MMKIKALAGVIIACTIISGCSDTKYVDEFNMAKQVYLNTVNKPNSPEHREAKTRLKRAALEFKSFLQLELPNVNESNKEFYKSRIKEMDELLESLDN